jgi:anti-sigma factor RsiW
MRCRECESLLWPFIDGELPPAQRRTVVAHLESCPQCGEAYEQLRAFPLQVGQLQLATPPADFSARLMERIALLPPPLQLAAQHERHRPHPWSGPTGLVVAFSAAAAAIIVGLIGTSAIALTDGSLAGNGGGASGGIGSAIGGGVTFSAWEHLSLPIVLALAAMLAILAVLWFRVVAPRR